MARKTGAEYAQNVRELRDAGLDFPARDGFLLADAGDWTTGQKSAVTRAFNQLDVDDSGEIERDEFVEDLTFFDDGAGDGEEEFDDIDYFDFDEGEEFEDDESDKYTED